MKQPKGKNTESIDRKLREAFTPTHLEVVDESFRHKAGPGAETHFKVTVVSENFSGKNAVARHRLIYGCLAAELESGVHALAIHSYTPTEWEKEQKAPASPPCASEK
jgi:BolA protein